MLKVEKVYKAYGSHAVLKGVNLNVAEGEIKGLIGVNGAGKSTLIELICGVKKIDSGKIVLDGIEVGKKEDNLKLKYTFGYMPQSFNLFNDLTVEENLRYLSAIYKLDEEKAVKRILKLCNLEKVKDKLAMTLSGGYRQLLSLSGAIIHQPKLLILDEPTSAMDPLFRNMFWKIVKGFQKDKCTILVITHYMEELLQCNSFACLAEGKTVFDDTLENYKTLGDLDIEKILALYSKEKRK